MGDFKRNSSRFNRGGDGGSSGGSRSGGGNGGGRSGGYSRGNSGGNSRSGGDNGGGEKKYPFTRVASLTVPKSASDDMNDYVHAELKGSEIRLNAQVYLGKGDNELRLKNGDMLLISFKVSDKDKDFVVGNVSIKND
jgi:hypothetical protein